MLHRQSLMVRLGLLIICGLLVLDMRYLWLSSGQMVVMVRDWGYWMMAVIFIGFAWVVIEVVSDAKKSFAEVGLKNIKWSLGLLLTLFIWQQIHEPRRLKVEFDESLLLSMSRSMHFEHKAGWAISANKYDGSTVTTAYGVDKRPIFFPFCVSLVHSAIGYRVGNVFLFNFLAGGALLFSAYLIGFYYNVKWGGLVAAALLAGVPLVAQNATGGGFDLFNTLLLAMLGICVRQYMLSPTKQKLLIMCLCSIALANVRYESILYVLAPCLAFFWVSYRQRKLPEISWLTILVPFGLFPSLLTNGVFNSREVFFQMPKEKFWGWGNFSENISHAIYYIFSPDRGGTNSVFLAVVGIISLLFFIFIIKDQIAKTTVMPAEGPALFCLVVCGAIHFCVLMGLAWGNWDDAVVSRFSLPFWLFLMWGALEFFRHVSARTSINLFRGVAFLAMLWVLLFANADASSAMQTRTFKASLGIEWATKFLERYDPDRTVLVLANSSIPYINNGYATISYGEVEDNIPQCLATVKYEMYRDVILILTEERSARLSDWAADLRVKELAKKCKFERLGRTVLDPFYRVTIYRVAGVNDGVVVPPFPKGDDPNNKENYKKRVYKLLP